MPKEPPELDLSEREIDTRVVTVFFHAGADYPEVDWDLCSSVYEAIGLLRAGMRHLDDEADIPTPEDD